MHCVKTIFSYYLRRPQYMTALHRDGFKKQFDKIYEPRCYLSHVERDETDKIIEELCKGDLEQEKNLRILMLEVEVMRQDGRRAPSSLQSRHWEQLLQMKTKKQRAIYLTYLFKTEMAKENEKARKEARKKELETVGVNKTKEFPDDIAYGLQGQKLFVRINDSSINKFDNYRLMQAMTYGQSLVIDCSYEKNMVWREIMNAAKQMTFLFGDNRIHKDPFNLHMCNVNLAGDFMKQLRKNIPSLEEPWYPINIHTKSYLDIFPKDKLVYLTPHCRNELTQFDQETIYIVGCIVDKSNNEAVSLAKAKRDGIKMAKLPLDRYLEWAPGSKKTLNINHMIPILLDLKLTGDWEFAFRHIPRRKLMETKILAMQKKFQSKLSIKEGVLRNSKYLYGVNPIFREKRKRPKQISIHDDND